MDDTEEPSTENITATQSIEDDSMQKANHEVNTIEEINESRLNEKNINTLLYISKESDDIKKPTEKVNVPKELENKIEKNEEQSEKQQKSNSTHENSLDAEAAEKEIASKVFKQPQQPMSTKSIENDDSDSGKYVTYEEDGSAIYTDPETKHQYKWSEKEKSWISAMVAVDGKENPFENEHYIWCQETQNWKPKATQVTETEHYKWDADKKEWIPKQSVNKQNEGVTYSVDENGQRNYTDKDGAVYFWDEEKNAWFPKIDDDFMARYQMNYGFIDNVSAGEEEKRKRAADEAEKKAEELQRMADEARAAMDDASGSNTATSFKRKATQEPPKWFEIDAAHNTKVYVSNLPLDITLDDFAELMGKCGMIMRDPQTQKYKLKLYTEADGQVKGDGLCDYIKIESVNLALSILDEYVYRGHKIHVQRAKFEMRGAYNPSLKPKRKKKDKEKLQKMKERLFDWRPEKMRGERTKNEKIVIIKNLFTPDIFEKEVQLILDYQNDLREECSKCGTVRKVVIYDCHPEGIAQINMASPEEADLVIQMMQGRYFGKRQLSAEHWDGKTKYKVAESEKEAQERLSNWDQFLETDSEKVDEKSC